MKREYKVPCEWREYGYLRIEANSPEEASKIATENADELPLPEGNYLDNTFRICTEDKVI